MAGPGGMVSTTANSEPERMRRTELATWLLLVACCLLVTASFAGRFWLLHVRGFDPDEFEHLHVAWYISKGFVPYRDFFENHTMALHYLLQPVFLAFDAERDTEQAFGAIFAARRLVWGFAGGAGASD
jgi:hypothetical protein